MNDAARAGPQPALTPIELRRRMSGLNFLEAILAGKLPAAPIATLMGFALVEAERGRVAFAGTPTLHHYNPHGSVHGGYAATMLDSCMGCAVHSVLAPGQGYTTLEIKVNFVRALTGSTGPLRAEGKIINVGRTIGSAEGRIVDAAGKLYAHGTTTCLIFAL